MMARSSRIYTINEVARLIGETVELVEQVTSNSDNVDYGEMVHVHDGTEYGATALTERGIECVEALLADIRTWEGGVRQFLVDQQCDPELIERVMAHEAQRSIGAGAPPAE
jgi:hypothetical protein